MRDKRQEEIHSKGFAFTSNSQIDYDPVANPIDFGKIRIGLQTLDDAVLDLGSFNKTNRQYGKAAILNAVAKNDYNTMREISDYFYRVSGIYERICRYFAYLYRYDWYVIPYIEDEDIKEDKILNEFSRVLNYLDNSNIKYMCGIIALEVVRHGVYYGYIIPGNDNFSLQQLPPAYCRSRYLVGNSPAVEFNMKFFDDKFGNIEQRLRILKMFPEEFAKGYVLYKKGKLRDDSGENTGSSDGWYLLDSKYAVKINFNGSDYPILLNAIPAILDLNDAQDLDRRKQMQKLLKVLIQKLPLDKNGDLLFDVDEAKDIHNNTVKMLSRAVGVDVMTTFADVQVADMADKNTTTTTDDLKKVERTVYNELGVSSNLFNTDGNLALNSSILNDEACTRNLLLQFNILLNRVIKVKFPSKKKYDFRATFLETTIYNYMELAKLYKEQVQIGYSKMLPQIALGNSQSSVLANAHFENDILHMPEMMVPPLMSSTMKGEDILGQKNQNKTQNQQSTSGNSTSSSETGGRPEKPDNEKSEKTIQNRESMS